MMDNITVNKDDNLLLDIKAFSDSLIDLVEDALKIFSPLVESLVQNQSQDAREIECLLDSMLGYAYDYRVLRFYKKLCKHYYFIDQEATVYYINAYHEMWDSD